MITAIYIGTDKLDLFNEENIVIKSNVARISDITKIYTDISNDFTVPASDVNNAIFKHWYNPNVLSSFDSRKKVPAFIEIGGVNFKVGKIKLKKVNLKSNKPYSYSLDFFGNLVDIKDKLKDDKLTDLDLSWLDFPYNSFQVKTKLVSQFSDVNFSLISNRRLLFDSDNDVVDDDKQTNIYYDANNNDTGLRISDIKASVKQLAVIEAIESKYGLSFSRDFLGLYDFSNQYLCLSGSEDKTTFQIPLTYSIGLPDNTVDGNVMLAEGFGTPSERVTVDIQLGIEIDDDYQDAIYSFYIKSDGLIVSKRENVKGSQLSNNILKTKNSNIVGGLNNVTFWIESSEPIIFKAQILRFNTVSQGTRIEYVTDFIEPTITFRISKRLPDLKIIDFLKGVFKQSKLIAVPEKDGTIYIDSLIEFYRKGKVYDLTKYIDFESYDVYQGKILSEIKYNYEDPQTILGIQFKNNNNIGFGDLELSIYDDDGDLIEGDSLDYKLPFEQLVYEKIIDLSNSQYNTNMQYALLQNESLDFVNIKPHVHYIQTVDAPVKYIEDNQTATKLVKVNVPSHVLDFDLQTYSTTFGTEYNSFDGQIINNTIYTNYHKPYIDRIFSQQTREYNFKAKDLPKSVVLNLKLNDVIKIKENYYRIETFETNTTNNNIDFKLINDRIVDLKPMHPVSLDNTVITLDRTDITLDDTQSEEIITLII